MNICDWMIKYHYASHPRHADNIFNGLELSRVPRFWVRVKLVMLYRLHRDSGEPSKVAYVKAIAGERPLQLFTEQAAG